MQDDSFLDNSTAHEPQHEPTSTTPTRVLALTPDTLPGQPPTSTAAPTPAQEDPPTITPEDKLPQELLLAVEHKSSPPLRAAYTYSRADLKGAMLLAVRRHGSLSCAARAVGIGRQTVYDWKEGDEAFALAIHQAQEGAIDALERSMLERAMAGDTVAGIFMLKGYRPRRWHDRARLEVSGPGGGPIPVWPGSEDERQELMETARRLAEAKGKTDASE